MADDPTTLPPGEYVARNMRVSEVSSEGITVAFDTETVAVEPGAPSAFVAYAREYPTVLTVEAAQAMKDQWVKSWSEAGGPNQTEVRALAEVAQATKGMKHWAPDPRWGSTPVGDHKTGVGVGVARVNAASALFQGAAAETGRRAQWALQTMIQNGITPSAEIVDEIYAAAREEVVDSVTGRTPAQPRLQNMPIAASDATYKVKALRTSLNFFPFATIAYVVEHFVAAAEEEPCDVCGTPTRCRYTVPAFERMFIHDEVIIETDADGNVRPPKPIMFPRHMLCQRAYVRRPRNLVEALNDALEGGERQGTPRLEHRERRWHLELQRSQEILDGVAIAEEEVRESTFATIEVYVREADLTEWLGDEPRRYATWPLVVPAGGAKLDYVLRRIPAAVHDVHRDEKGELLEVWLRDETSPSGALWHLTRWDARCDWGDLISGAESITACHAAGPGARARPRFGRRLVYPPAPAV